MNRNALFVYGTLRRGGSNHFRMEGAEYVGGGTVCGVIYRIDSNRDFIYPALVCGGDRRVRGDVFFVSDQILGALDRYEGDEYRRVRVSVSMDDDTEKEVWAWEWNRALDDAVLLDDGDWLNHEPDPQ